MRHPARPPETGRQLPGHDPQGRPFVFPSPPAETRAEYVVSSCKWMLDDEGGAAPVIRRKVFHSLAKAYAHRDRLERAERDGGPVAIQVRIDVRRTGPWQELA